MASYRDLEPHPRTGDRSPYWYRGQVPYLVRPLLVLSRDLCQNLGTLHVSDTEKHLLLVEDEAPLREAIAEQLTDRGYHVEQAGSGEEAIERLADFAFDIIVTDLRLPGVDGSAVVEAAVERYPHIIAIVVTGYGTVKDAVEAIKRGAWDFVSKPFQIDELLHVLDSAIEQRRLKSENAYLRAQLEERYRFEGIIGKSRPMVLFVAATVSRSWNSFAIARLFPTMPSNR